MTTADEAFWYRLFCFFIECLLWGRKIERYCENDSRGVDGYCANRFDSSENVTTADQALRHILFSFLSWCLICRREIKRCCEKDSRDVDCCRVDRNVSPRVRFVPGPNSHPVNQLTRRRGGRLRLWARPSYRNTRQHSPHSELRCFGSDFDRNNRKSLFCTQVCVRHTLEKGVEFWSKSAHLLF